jgi:hypothetical protein
MRGTGEYIPTRILTGPHSVASYNTQGDMEDPCGFAIDEITITYLLCKGNYFIYTVF